MLVELVLKYTNFHMIISIDIIKKSTSLFHICESKSDVETGTGSVSGSGPTPVGNQAAELGNFGVAQWPWITDPSIQNTRQNLVIGEQHIRSSCFCQTTSQSSRYPATN